MTVTLAPPISRMVGVGTATTGTSISQTEIPDLFEIEIEEDAARPGDYGVLMTMRPGSTIETALVQW